MLSEEKQVPFQINGVERIFAMNYILEYILSKEDRLNLAYCGKLRTAGRSIKGLTVWCIHNLSKDQRKELLQAVKINAESQVSDNLPFLFGRGRGKS